MMKHYKDAITKKYKEVSEINLTPLLGLKRRVKEMNESGGKLIEELSAKLVPATKFTEETKRDIEGIFLNEFVVKIIR